MWVLTRLNTVLSKLSYSLAMLIVAIMVMALSLSAITRYISGTGYDWLIELPPILVCWLVFPLLGPLLKEGNHIQVDFISSVVPSGVILYIKVAMNMTAFLASLVFFKAGYDATMLYYRLGQMMELELDWQEKVKLVLEVHQVAICIFLLMFIHMIYLREVRKIYFLNAQYQLQMQH